MTGRGWTIPMLALAAAPAGCSNECEAPVPVLCCAGGCNGDPMVPAMCTPRGLACPAGSVASGQCPHEVPYCAGAGPTRDGGP
jgi:hypothetical protein